MSRSTALAAAALATALLGGSAATPAGAADDPNDAFPTAGCSNITDPKGDAYVGYGLLASKTVNDADLDIVGIAMHLTPTALKVFLRIDNLANAPTAGTGNSFDVTFKTGGKTILLSERFVNGQTALSGHWVTVGGTKNATVKLDTLEDATKEYVVFTLDRATLVAAVPGALEPGSPLEAFSAQSGTYFLWNGTAAVDQHDVADLASLELNADPYKLAVDDKCFPPPPAVLSNVGAVKTAYSDAASVATKVLDAAGAPLVGRSVTFKIGSKSATATTGSDGVARTLLDPGLAAGSYTMVASFAGDATASKAEIPTPFTVTTEATKMKLTVVNSGTKRTVTAKLTDDDGKPLAGQTVVWTVNGKTVATMKTNSSGAVVLTTAKPTQTVAASFAGTTGKYAPVKATAKV